MKRTTGLLFSLLLLLLLSACGGGGNGDPAAGDPNPQVDPEVMAMLQAELDRVFDDLGIDPDKVVAVAPQGAINSVFDLAATAIDPDGGGPNPPTGIELRWTERHVGDYDMNGEVNVGDLTPLGQYFQQSVEYDDPSLHNGLEYWPSGDPDGDGALNWRKARIDGDDNGLLTIADITPIGQNFRTTTSGFRVYRRAPGEVGFTLLPHTDGTSPFTVSRPTIDPFAPVRYNFTPGGALVNGTYEFYVVPYHTADDDEGAQSVTASIVINGGSSNQPPTADITATPQSGPIPLDVDFDASGSSDSDGSIVEYEWDIDGNGSFELNTGAVATTSTTYNSAGVRNVKVRVTDDEGASATDNINVNAVDGGNNLAPTAHFTIDPEPASGTAPLSVQFDASGSSDPDGSINGYDWDWDGDGTFDEITFVSSVEHTYNSPGTFKPRLRVRDNFIPAASNVYVYPGDIVVDAPDTPVADLQADPTSGSAPLLVNFDASGSSPGGDATITLYEFDLDGDGVYELSQGTPTTSFTYTENGPPITARVKVTNSNAQVSPPASVVITLDFTGWVTTAIDGNGATHISLAIVEGNPAVAYKLNADGLKFARCADEFGTGEWADVFADPKDDLNVHYGNGISSDLFIVDGNPAVAYFEDSPDVGSGTTFSDVKFVRATDSLGTAWGSPVIIESDLQSHFGIPAVSGIVAGGNPSVAWRDPVAGVVRFARANDSTGSSWPNSFVTVASENAYETDLQIIGGNPALCLFVPGEESATQRYIRATDANGSAWSGGVNAGNGMSSELLIVNGNPAVVGCAPIPTSDFFQVRYSRGNDANGTSWGSTQNLTEETGDIERVNRGAGFAVLGGVPAIAYVDRIAQKLLLIRGNDANGTSFGAAETVVDGVTGTSSGWCQLIGVGPTQSQPCIVYVRKENPSRGMKCLTFFE